jgi:hypothetical protein
VSRKTRASISLCGVPVRAENVRLLAGKLDGDLLAQKLERALVNDNSIVALSFEERKRIVDVIGGEPGGLAGLRAELEAQVKRHKNHTEKLEQAKRYRELEERRSLQR